MNIYEIQQNDFCISTDKSKLDISIIHHYLSKESYWAKNIPLETVQRSIEGSYCFGLYVTENSIAKQVGFARVISDCATFAYLADVFVLESYRGQGLSKWLMKTIMECPYLQGLRRWLLATKDAHGLYLQFGFTALDKPERIMGFKPFETYPETNS
ncbi:MAG: GNAT family N-acetyltransferase [Ferruginibacter sp.]